jgi:hypothetical protein
MDLPPPPPPPEYFDFEPDDEPIEAFPRLVAPRWLCFTASWPRP